MKENKPRISEELLKKEAFRIPGYHGNDYTFNSIKGAGELLTELSNLSIKNYKYIYQVCFRAILETAVNELINAKIIEEKNNFVKEAKMVLAKLQNLGQKNNILTRICNEKNSDNGTISYNSMNNYLKKIYSQGNWQVLFSNVVIHRTGEIVISTDELKEFTQFVYVFAVLADRWLEL